MQPKSAEATGSPKRFTSQHEKATYFRDLHQQPGAFVIANAWDGGSARLLAGLGFPALATSSGAAAGVLPFAAAFFGLRWCLAQLRARRSKSQPPTD